MKHILCKTFSGFLFAAAMTGHSPSHAAAALDLKIGQVKVLKPGGIDRVAVGDGRIIHAVAENNEEVILFARGAGETTLQIWDHAGKSKAYQIRVASGAQKQLQEDIRNVVARIPNVRASVVGAKVIVEGDQLTDSDRERLTLLMKHYPQIVNMTSQVGWDQMVMLDVQVVEVPKNFLREFGVKWQNATQGGINVGLVWDSRSKRLLDRPGEGYISASFPSYSPLPYLGMNALLGSTIQLMVNEGEAVMLAQPQLMARSGSTAQFLAGGEVPYSVTDRNGTAQTMFKPYGVALQITPRIERNGIVRSKISVEVSSVDHSMQYDGGPALKIRRTSTEFNVRSGETLVLSGFISREQLQNIDKVPGLGDIPIISTLFKSKRFQRNETELAIFVRPVLVSSEHPDQIARVNNAQQLIDRTFDVAPIINTPLRADEPEHELGIAHHSAFMQLGDPNTYAFQHPLQDSPWLPDGAQLQIQSEMPDLVPLVSDEFWRSGSVQPNAPHQSAEVKPIAPPKPAASGDYE